MRRRTPIAASVLAGAALLVAGCGGQKEYTLEKTRPCLEGTPGIEVRSKVDFVASTALGGAVNVRFPRTKNQVTISFGLDRDEAGRIVKAYQRFRGKNIGLADVLRPDRNAVLLWAIHPSDGDIKAVGDCLR